jgi:hypothetical protein
MDDLVWSTGTGLLVFDGYGPVAKVAMLTRELVCQRDRLARRPELAEGGSGGWDLAVL